MSTSTNHPADEVDDITQLTTKLQMSPNETSPSAVEDDTEKLLVKSIEELSLDTFSETSMVARVFSRKCFSISFLKNIFNRMWKFKESWQVQHLGVDHKSSFYGFSFASPENQEWVIQRTPWIFTGGFLLGVPWPESGKWQEANLTKIPLSLSINNIPLKLYTRSNLTSWVKAADPNAEIKWKGSNLDMICAYTVTKVNVPVDSRPCVGLFIEFEGRKKWLQFKFERLPLICYRCGIWGHENVGCTNKPVVIRDPEDPERKIWQLYGPWLSGSNVGDCFTPFFANKEGKIQDLEGLSKEKELEINQPENDNGRNSTTILNNHLHENPCKSQKTQHAIVQYTDDSTTHTQTTMDQAATNPASDNHETHIKNAENPMNRKRISIKDKARKNGGKKSKTETFPYLEAVEKEVNLSMVEPTIFDEPEASPFHWACLDK